MIKVATFSGVPVSCHDCAYLNQYDWRRCTAFPKGIPILITSGQFSHLGPFPIDQGIHFEPSEEFLQMLLAAGADPEKLANEKDKIRNY